MKIHRTYHAPSQLRTIQVSLKNLLI